MKICFFIAVFIIARATVHCQPAASSDVQKLVRQIERQLGVSDKLKTNGTSELFFYDLSLDLEGNISTIHVLLFDSLTSIREVVHFGERIRKDFHFRGTKVKKVLIPVLIVHSGREEIVSDAESSAYGTVQVLTALSRNSKTILISRMALVMQMQERNKKNR